MRPISTLAIAFIGTRRDIVLLSLCSKLREALRLRVTQHRTEVDVAPPVPDVDVDVASLMPVQDVASSSSNALVFASTPRPALPPVFSVCSQNPLCNQPSLEVVWSKDPFAKDTKLQGQLHPPSPL